MAIPRACTTVGPATSSVGVLSLNTKTRSDACWGLVYFRTHGSFVHALRVPSQTGRTIYGSLKLNNTRYTDIDAREPLHRLHVHLRPRPRRRPHARCGTVDTDTYIDRLRLCTGVCRRRRRRLLSDLHQTRDGASCRHLGRWALERHQQQVFISAVCAARLIDEGDG